MAEENSSDIQIRGHFREDTPHGDYSGKIGTVPHPDGKHEMVYRTGNQPIANSQRVDGLTGIETVSLQKTAEYQHQLNAKTDNPEIPSNTTQEPENISDLEKYRQQREAEKFDKNIPAAGDR